VVAAALFVLKGAFFHTQPKNTPVLPEGGAKFGTITYLDLEGGFFGILDESGEHLDPINLSKEFQKDGLKVRFWYEEQKDAIGIHMWGKIIKIKKIERA